jgi:hypothetical protein
MNWITALLGLFRLGVILHRHRADRDMRTAAEQYVAQAERESYARWQTKRAEEIRQEMTAAIGSEPTVEAMAAWVAQREAESTYQLHHGDRNWDELNMTKLAAAHAQRWASHLARPEEEARAILLASAHAADIIHAKFALEREHLRHAMETAIGPTPTVEALAGWIAERSAHEVYELCKDDKEYEPLVDGFASDEVAKLVQQLAPLYDPDAVIRQAVPSVVERTRRMLHANSAGQPSF